MNSFSKNSIKYFLHNPLSVIGFFITICYCFTVIVFEEGLNKLNGPYERLPFIYFIILFPLIILGTFVYLVCYHHEKLYSPSDFKDENNFLKLSSKEKENKIKTEAADVLLSEKNSFSDSDSGNTKSSYSFLMYSIENAEHLAIQKLTEEYNISFMENVRYRNFIFDAYAEHNHNRYIAEFKFIKGYFSEKNLLENYKRISNYKNAFSGNVNVVLVYILEHYTDELKRRILNSHKLIAEDLSIKIYDYEKLKKEYKSLPNKKDC